MQHLINEIQDLINESASLNLIKQEFLIPLKLNSWQRSAICSRIKALVNKSTPPSPILLWVLEHDTKSLNHEFTCNQDFDSVLSSFQVIDSPNEAEITAFNSSIMEIKRDLEIYIAYLRDFIDHVDFVPSIQDLIDLEIKLQKLNENEHYKSTILRKFDTKQEFIDHELNDIINELANLESPIVYKKLDIVNEGNQECLVPRPPVSPIPNVSLSRPVSRIGVDSKITGRSPLPALVSRGGRIPRYVVSVAPTESVIGSSITRSRIPRVQRAKN